MGDTVMPKWPPFESDPGFVTVERVLGALTVVEVEFVNHGTCVVELEHETPWGLQAKIEARRARRRWWRR